VIRNLIRKQRNMQQPITLFLSIADPTALLAFTAA
jgi:hypothetical protein